MKVVLLAGGKGKRLWPLSTEDNPKQFIKVLDSVSMLQKTYRHVLEICDDVYVSTNKKYVEQVKEELPNINNMIVEPESIGTFGAILNIAYYLHSEKNVDKNEIISIVPIDHDVDSNFYKSLLTAEKKLKDENKDICLIGIVPSYPETQYGYIMSDNGTVISFEEKPNEIDAMRYISNGGLWNSGVLVFRLNKLLKIISKYVSFRSYDKFLKNYTILPHNSFDKEVLEYEKNISIIKSFSKWKDMGTIENIISNISIQDKYNTNIYNTENKKIINEGIENAIIINSRNGIKIQKKRIHNMIYEKWGKYENLYDYNESLYHVENRIVTILPNKEIFYDCCNNINEQLIVLIGTGEIHADGKMKKIRKGTIIEIKNNKHYLIKTNDLLKLYQIRYWEENHEESLEQNDVLGGEK